MKFSLLLLSFYCAFNFVDSKIVDNSWVTVSRITRFKKDVENDNNDYIYACGEEFMETKCKCDKNILDCNFNGLQNLNIHIITENFTVKFAKFNNNGITILKKKWILPGREYSIQKLDFSKNKISMIENGTFDEFKKLEELILIGNQLTNINENILTESLGKTLIHLDLKENKLQEINAKTFVNMKKLEYLSLSMNPSLMPYLNKNVFSTSLANLKHLDLTWCNISTLEDDIFENLNIRYPMLFKTID
uniref:Uncharacterized protein n=1 Tax=Panagrolaimus sp. PS1159 TaxID=55785 RepID=A0AC35GCB2_9BILA